MKTWTIYLVERIQLKQNYFYCYNYQLGKLLITSISHHSQYQNFPKTMQTRKKRKNKQQPTNLFQLSLTAYVTSPSDSNVLADRMESFIAILCSCFEPNRPNVKIENKKDIVSNWGWSRSQIFFFFFF